MGILTDILREAGRKSAVPSATGSGVGQISEREQAIIDRHTSEAGRGSLLQGVAKVRAQKEIDARKQQRAYAEQAPPEVSGPVKEMLSNLDDRTKVRSIYQKLTPEQRQEALNLVPGISQQLGDDRGGAISRIGGALRRGVSTISQPAVELADKVIGTDWGGTPEEIAFIRQMEAAKSQEFAPALPSDPWYERFPLQALEMVPFSAATIGGGAVGGAVGKVGGNALARGAAAGVPGARGVVQAAGAVGRIPTAVGLPAMTAQGVGTVAGITAVGFPGQYAQEVDQLKELGVEDGPGMQALAVGTALASSALEAIMPNPFKGVLPAGEVAMRDGALKAARQYLWEAVKRAPTEMTEEYAQGLASGLGKTVASYLDMTTQDVTLGDAFATSFEQGNAAIGPMAFLLGVPAAGGAAYTAFRARGGTPPGPPPPAVAPPAGGQSDVASDVMRPGEQVVVEPPTTVPQDQSRNAVIAQRLAALNKPPGAHKWAEINLNDRNLYEQAPSKEVIAEQWREARIGQRVKSQQDRFRTKVGERREGELWSDPMNPFRFSVAEPEAAAELANRKTYLPQDFQETVGVTTPDANLRRQWKTWLQEAVNLEPDVAEALQQEPSGVLDSTWTRIADGLQPPQSNSVEVRKTSFGTLVRLKPPSSAQQQQQPPQGVPDASQVPTNEGGVQVQGDAEQVRQAEAEADGTQVQVEPPKPQPIRVYHGTNADSFTQFDDAKIGSSTDSGLLGAGHYFSTDAEGMKRDKKTLVTADISLSNPLKLSMPNFKTDKNVLANKAIGTTGLVGKELSDAIKAKGFDGVELDYSPTGYVHKEYAVFDVAGVKVTPATDVAQPPVTPAPQQTNRSWDMPLAEYEKLASGEKVVGVANMTNTGRIVRGAIHADAKPPKGETIAEEGFVTSSGRFIDRVEAAMLTGGDYWKSVVDGSQTGSSEGVLSEPEEQEAKQIAEYHRWATTSKSKSPQQTEATTTTPAEEGGRWVEVPNDAVLEPGKEIRLDIEKGKTYVWEPTQEVTPEPKKRRGKTAEPGQIPRPAPTGEQDTGTERELSGNRTGTEQPEAGVPTTTAEQERIAEIDSELERLQAQYEKKLNSGGRSGMVPPSIKGDALSQITKKMDELDAEKKQLLAKSEVGPTTTAEQDPAAEAQPDRVKQIQDSFPVSKEEAIAADILMDLMALPRDVEIAPPGTPIPGDVLTQAVRVTPELAKKLNSGKKVKLYRSMMLIDGKLYPPMSGKVKGDDGKSRLREPEQIGVWMRSEERPDLIATTGKNAGKFLLKKAGDGTDVWVAYAPYFHASPMPLNDQFSAAWKNDGIERPQLVTVEVEVPASEMTSGYQAEKSPKKVGSNKWNAGVVAGKIPGGREVVLSRYARIKRIVPDSEVAEKIAEVVNPSRLAIPINMVTPQLRKELEKRGVKIAPEYKKGDDIFYQKDTPRWHSKARALIEEKMGPKASPQQVLAMLKKNGVKEDELQWSGLEELLGGATSLKSITKEEVLAALDNGVQVGEVVLPGEPKVDVTFASRTAAWEIDELDGAEPGEYQPVIDGERHRGFITVNEDGTAEYRFSGDTRNFQSARGLQEWLRNERRETMLLEADGVGTKFASYTLPGGENYQELLLTLPTRREAGKVVPFDQWLPKQPWYATWRSAGENLEKAQHLYREWVDRAERGRDTQNYRSSHYDEPNIVAHIRFNERTDADGKKVLFLEEVQSDWHQAGRKKGYGPQTEAHVEAYYVVPKTGEKVSIGFGKTEAEAAQSIDPGWEQVLESIGQKPQFSTTQRKIGEGVPDAPFKKTWHMLAMKRAIQYAAENGFDRVAWATGEQQAERYDLSKQVKHIGWDARGKYGKHVSIEIKNSDSVLEFDVKDGKAFNPNGPATSAGLGGKELEDVVGKDIAKQILDGDSGSLKGPQLSVGGEGMKAFYDKMLPNEVNKFIKKFGAKVGEAKIVTQEAMAAQEDSIERVRKYREVADYESEGYVFADGAGKEITADEARKAIESGDTGVTAYKPPVAELMSAVPSFDITPAMRDSALAHGQPLFQKQRDQQGTIQAWTHFVRAAKGMVASKAIIGATDKADVSSPFHELGHPMREFLFNKEVSQEERGNITDDDIDYMENFLGVEDGNWTRDNEESFVDALMKYWREGNHPNKKIESIFKKISAWLSKVFSVLERTRDIELDDRVRAIFHKVHERGGIIDPEKLQALKEAEVSAAEDVAEESAEDSEAEFGDLFAEVFGETTTEDSSNERAITEQQADSGPEKGEKRPAEDKEATGRIKGRTTKVGKRKAHYEVVELTELTASHHPFGLNVNESFPAEWQKHQRRYENLSADLKMDVALPEGGFDPARLLDPTNYHQEGPTMVVEHDGKLFVVGGTRRFMILVNQYDRSEDRGQLYHDALMDDAEAFGVDAETVNGMSQPILIRVIDEHGDVATLIDELNVISTFAKDLATEAASLGRGVGRNTVAVLRTIGDEETLNKFLDRKGVAVVQAMVKDNPELQVQMPGWVRNSALTKDAKLAVQNAIMGAVIPDATLLSQASPSLLQSVNGALSEIVALNQKGGEWTLSKRIEEAIIYDAEFRSTGEPAHASKIRNWMNSAQQSFLEGFAKDETSDGYRLWRYLLAHGGVRKFRAALQETMIREARLDSSKGGLFAETEESMSGNEAFELLLSSGIPRGIQGGDGGRQDAGDTDTLFQSQVDSKRQAAQLAKDALEDGAKTFEDYVDYAVQEIGRDKVKAIADAMKWFWANLRKQPQYKNLPKAGSVAAVLAKTPEPVTPEQPKQKQKQPEKPAEKPKESSTGRFFPRVPGVRKPGQPFPDDQAEPEPYEPHELTGMAKAVMNDLRELAGIPELGAGPPESTEQWALDAQSTMAADPYAATRLLNDIIANPYRALDQHDVMLLVFRYRALVNEAEPHFQELKDANASGNAERIAQARTNYILARQPVTEFEELTLKAKATWGRTGIALQILLRRDNTVAGLLRRAREANHGKPLTPEQEIEIRDLADRFAAVQKKLDEALARADKAEAEVASLRHLKELVKESPTRKRPSKEQKSELDKSWADIAKLANVNVLFQRDAANPFHNNVQVYRDLGVETFAELRRHVQERLGKEQAAKLEDQFKEAWEATKPETEVPANIDRGNLAQLTREARRIERSIVEGLMLDHSKEAVIEMRDEIVNAVHAEMQELLDKSFTHRQTMDALSGYGQFSRPSQETADTLLRNLNAEVLKLRQIDQLGDAVARVDQLRDSNKDITDAEIADILIKEGLLVAQTGLVRDPPSDRLRDLNRQYNEKKKDIPASSEGRPGLLQTAVAAIERGLANRIRDLNHAINKQEPIKIGRKEPLTNPKIEQLKEERDALLKEYRKLFPAEKKKLTPEQRLANTIKAAERSIEVLEKQIATRNFDKQEQEALPESPELTELRERLEHLRDQRNVAKALELSQWESEGGAVGPDPKEAAYRKAYIASLSNRIAKLQQFMREGDFSPQENKKSPRILSKEELDLKTQLAELNTEKLKKMADYHLSHLKGIAWAADKISEVLHLARAVETMADLSALGTQGGLIALGRPALAKNALVGVIKSMAQQFDKSAIFNKQDLKLSELEQFLTGIDSRKAELAFMHQLTEGEWGEYRQLAGLDLPSTDQAITRQEEVFQGRWGKYFPGVAISSRLYTMILNKMRADMFDLMVEKLGRQGKPTLEEAKLIASFVNVMTGRSDFKQFNSYAAILNNVFFAPRYVASRFQYLAMPFYLPFKGGVKANWQIKRAIYREYARTASGAVLTLGLISMAGYLFWDDDDEDKPTVGVDPTTSDFLKAKFGETRMDLLAGLQQVFVLSARMLPEELGGGRIGDKKYGEGGPYAQSRATVMARFLRTKLAPGPGYVVTGLNDWENVIGEKADRVFGLKVHPAIGTTTNLFFPLSMQSVAEAFETQPVPVASGVSILSILGVRMSTYGPKTEYMTGTPEERQKQIDGDLENLEWDAPNPSYSEFLTKEQLDQFEKRRTNRVGLKLSQAISDPESELGKKTRDKALELIKESKRLGRTRAEAIKAYMDYWQENNKKNGRKASTHEIVDGSRVMKAALRKGINKVKALYRD